MVNLARVKSIIKWFLYLMSASIAILFIIKGEAIEQYRSKATTFKRKEIPVSKRPVVTICPKLPARYKYGMDFNISIGSILANLGINSVKCSDFYSYHQAIYDDCNYDYLDISETSFILESVYNHWSGTQCYKVVYDPNIIYDEKVSFQVVFVFGGSIPYEELPETIDVYLTSNDNSHGVILNSWIDGDELSFKFHKVKLIKIITKC